MKGNECGRISLGTHGRTSSRFARAPGLSGITTSHSYVLGVEEAILNCVIPRRAGDAVAETAGRGADASSVLAMRFRRAAIPGRCETGTIFGRSSSGVVGFSFISCEGVCSRDACAVRSCKGAPVPAYSCERRNCPPFDFNFIY